MLRVALVEDSQEEADTLTGHLDRYGRARDIRMTVARFSNAMEFMGARQVFDLVFLDIDLPGINGMELAGLIRAYDTEVAIIFVTNLAQFAVRGYEVNALDFVLKPVSYFNFAMRMDKVARLMRRKSEGHVVVETREQARVVSFDDLVYVAVNNHRLSYRVRGTDGFLESRGSLKAVETRLADGPFVLISSSCLVNMNYVRSYHGTSLLLTNGEELYFSRPKRREATEKIAAFFGGSI
ncbi:LytR/AlgR family response regulator transcription factor [Paratractidigestivibacter faecalis]|uniref:LytTR family DNA-binding domain-containing protein n=1 Tax=Paratractidigestivibacter faecalis TaxID=2292441 RepID=A0ABV1IEZ8_9ACTN